MLGPAFSFKCLLSPVVKIHLFRTYTSPIIQSGLSSFSLRKNVLEPLAVFHRKSLKGILNLSKFASTSAIHFLLGELPIEGKIHRDVFSLFFSVWKNPSSKIYGVVKHILETSETNSRTWAVHVKSLSEKYGLPQPLDCLKHDPPSKSEYRELILTKICSYFENELRSKAKTNSSMQFFNVSVTGLRGRRHPALSTVTTTYEVQKSRIHLKMLVGDYLTYDLKSIRSGGSPHCRCCSNQSSAKEDIVHILTQCDAYNDIRERIYPEFSAVCNESKSGLEFQTLHSEYSLTQFILDPSSLNLERRININDPVLEKLFQVSRDFCYTINSRRIEQLRRLDQTKKR